MTEARSKELVAEARRRGLLWGTWSSYAFGKQREYIESPDRFKAALCSRRSGKTTAAALMLLRTAFEHPGTIGVYLALTRASAKRLMWDELARWCQRFGLEVQWNHTDLQATFVNGSQVFLAGADDAATIERLRGGKYKAVVIDEAGSFRPSVLHTLVREVVRPALLDLRGTLAMQGTPGVVPRGLFYEVTDGPDEQTRWSTWRWTVLDNPHVPDPAAYLEDELRLNRWTREHPIFRREWLGEWTLASDQMVYRLDPARNLVAEAPHLEAARYVLGIDYGHTHSTAFCVLAWDEQRPDAVWVLESAKHKGLIPSEAAEIVKRYMARFAFSCMVGDAGGLGKGYMEEARRRFQIPVMPAEKQNKRGYIELLNGSLVTGDLRLVVGKNRELVAEMEGLPWDEDMLLPADGFEDHACDAMLYGWRAAKAWAGKAPKPKPVYGTEAYWAEEEERQLRAEQKASTSGKGVLDGQGSSRFRC